MKKCSKCSQENQDSAKFCMGCGASMSAEKLYQQAVAIVLETRKASISSLQRKLSIGYAEAALLIETMEKRGLVSSMSDEGQRDILVSEHEITKDSFSNISKGVTDMSFEQELEKIVNEFRADPRNKIFVPFNVLVASATAETGNEIDEKTLKDVISLYLSGDMDGDQESIYDGAVFACGHLARHCFGEDPEDDIDYEIHWLEEDDGFFTALIRPI